MPPAGCARKILTTARAASEPSMMSNGSSPSPGRTGKRPLRMRSSLTASSPADPAVDHHARAEDRDGDVTRVRGDEQLRFVLRLLVRVHEARRMTELRLQNPADTPAGDEGRADVPDLHEVWNAGCELQDVARRLDVGASRLRKRQAEDR